MRAFHRVSLCLLLTCNLMQAGEAVVLLHGLARTSSSMNKVETALTQAGYSVFNIDYPSRESTVEDLSRLVRTEIERIGPEFERIHFVTHSMGGIILRYIQHHYPVENIGRAVMLSPPNNGSEVVDTLSGFTLFKAINGPAGEQLGTRENSLPIELGPVDFELGIITGDRSINWINSLLIPGKDDGKVSTESAKVNGMQAFKVVHATHPFIMKRSPVIRDVLMFLETGEFTAEVY